MGITAIALAAAMVGPANIESAQSRAAQFELITQHHSIMSGRPIGPVSLRVADRYVSEYERVRRNSALIIPDIGSQIRAVLTASPVQLERQISSLVPDLTIQARLEAGIRRDSRCVSLLTEASFSAGKPLRIVAVQALLPMPIERTRAAFVKHLAGNDPALRCAAAYALARHNDDRGANVLWEELAQPVQRWPRSFRFDVANALMDAGQAKTRPQLDKLFKLLEADARRLCPRLAARGDKVALQKLRHSLTDLSLYHAVRKWAAMALGDIRDKRAVPQLRRALGDEVESVRTEAATALVRILR